MNLVESSGGVPAARARRGALRTPRPALYSAATTVVVAESVVGGVADLLRLDPFFPVLGHLGYPDYLATILGAAKLGAAVVVAAPRLPRLKEWAYAGLMINMVGAVASHVAVGDGPAEWTAPLVFSAVVMASWALRPPSRRLPDPDGPPPGQAGSGTAVAGGLSTRAGSTVTSSSPGSAATDSDTSAR